MIELKEYKVLRADGTVMFMQLLWDGVSDTMGFRSGFGFVSVHDCKRNGWRIVRA